MKIDFTGQTAIVTGASRGIGKKIANDLDNNKFEIDFITSIGDYQIQLIILGILQNAGLQEEAFNLLVLSGDLTTLRVEESKNQGVKLAETVASGVTNIFSIFGSFSIMVGMLLIFLVFVLLAAARSTELGMARAVGLKRRDLIQLFTYEGTVYSFLAAMVGTPVVGIFGPGHPNTTGPFMAPAKYEILTQNYSCSPCRQRFFKECKPSPNNKPYCLEDITINNVYEAIHRLLKRF